MKSVGRQPQRLKPWAIAGYFTLFALNALIFLTWVSPEDRFIDFDRLVPGIYSHTTNLVISSMLVLGAGVVVLVTGLGLRRIVGFGLVVVAANYGYELLLTLWNVKDPIDAHYGAVGVLVALGFLWAVDRSGLTPRTPSQREE